MGVNGVVSIFVLFALLAWAALAIDSRRGVTWAPRVVHGRRRGINDFCQALDGSHINLQGNGLGVLTNPVSVYMMYYGSFPAADVTYLNNLANTISSHNWWNAISSSHYSSNSTCATNMVTVAGFSVNSSPSIATLDSTTSQVFSIVQEFVNANHWPWDVNAIYMVILGQSVGWTDDMTCGYHASASVVGGGTITFGIVHNHAPHSACIIQTQYAETTVTNFAQSLATVLAHEIAEAVTDNDLTNGWLQQKDPQENGDVCNFCFGTGSMTSMNGALYNIILGANNFKYLIQQMYDIRNRTCVFAPSKLPIQCTYSPSTQSFPVVVVAATVSAIGGLVLLAILVVVVVIRANRRPPVAPRVPATPPQRAVMY